MVAGWRRSGGDQLFAELQKVPLVSGLRRGVVEYRPADGERLSLSNFSIIENRQTHDLEIFMTRTGEDAHDCWHASVHRYIFTPS